MPEEERNRNIEMLREIASRIPPIVPPVITTPVTSVTPADVQFKCSACENEYSRRESYHTTIGDDDLCHACFYDSYFSCELCGDEDHNDNSYSATGDRIICGNCRDISTECTACNYYIPDGEEAIDMGENEWNCEYCAENATIDNRPRALQQKGFSTEIIPSTDHGRYITSPRTFGVELETLMPEKKEDHESILTGVKNFPRFGNHGDGSISGKTQGVEWNSPPLQGKAGELELIRFSRFLMKNKVTVNKTCGFHAHIGVPELRTPDSKRIDEIQQELMRMWEENARSGSVRSNDPSYGRYLIDYYSRVIPPDRQPLNLHEQKLYEELRSLLGRVSDFKILKSILMHYYAVDSLLRAMLPYSRRRNSYCTPVRDDVSWNELKSADTIEKLIAVWYNATRRADIYLAIFEKKYNVGSRYRGINIHSIYTKQSPTIEIRYHSPTINYVKILNWVAIHQAIIDKAIEKAGLSHEKLLDMLEAEALPERIKLFCDYFSIPPRLERYIKKRVGLFTHVREDIGEVK